MQLARAPKTVAVMQPYFVPYAGYFRLFAAADVVVLFDCVQFPRRGWVHRNRFTLASGELDWLTLPLSKSPRETAIAEITFAPNAAERLRTSMLRFPQLAAALLERHPLTERVLALGTGTLADYLCSLIEDITESLGFRPEILRSSALQIPAALRGQERVIEIVRRLGAARYVNPSGGRALYDPARFAASGVELSFLTPFQGPTESILARLLTQSASSLANDILVQSVPA